MLNGRKGLEAGYWMLVGDEQMGVFEGLLKIGEVVQGEMIDGVYDEWLRMCCLV